MVYLRTHFRKSPRLTDVARAAHFSPFHFHRLFRRHFGKTFKQVITELQIDEAKHLLLQGIDAKTVARMVGFGHQSHFGTRFKTIVGEPPVEWLKRQRAAHQEEQRSNPS